MRALSRQPRQAGRQEPLRAGNRALDDAVGLARLPPHEVRQRRRADAERGEAGRRGLDIAVGVDEGGEMAGFGKAADRPFGDVGSLRAPPVGAGTASRIASSPSGSVIALARKATARLVMPVARRT